MIKSRVKNIGMDQSKQFEPKKMTMLANMIIDNMKLKNNHKHHEIDILCYMKIEGVLLFY